MSSQPERSEKICLNCNATLVGRFCHECGQENIVTKQDFWSLTKHFVYDLVHFDGKFFETLKHLMFSPGRVPKEFVAGKRVSFLQPIRMYLFTSAFFFLVFFSVNSFNFTPVEVPLTMEERRKLAETYREVIEKTPDSAIQSKIPVLLDSTRQLLPSELFNGTPFLINGRFYRTVREYDSVQRALPKNEKDEKVKYVITRKLISLHASNNLGPNEVMEAFLNDFIHNFPYMLFLSLPFFAGILKLLYIRRKELFYSDHAVFTIYHYILSFILMLIMFALVQTDNRLHWKIFRFLGMGLAIWWLVYLYISMRRFYRQSWPKTLLKFILLSVTAALLMLALFLIFLFITAYQL